MAAPALQERAEWLEKRRQYLGGTDVAAIVGKSRWASPLSVYEAKVLGKDDPAAPEAAEAGLCLEPLIRDWFKRDTGLDVQFGVQHVTHPQFPFLGANPDGLVGEDALLEIKTHGIHTAGDWGEEGTDEIPDAYHIQCVWYLGLTGREVAHVVAVDTGCWKRRYYTVHADGPYFDALVRQAVRFWKEHVEPKVQPAATGHPSEVEVLRRIHPRDNGEIAFAGAEIDAAAERYLQLTADIDVLESEQLAEKAKIIAAIGDASGVQTAFGPFTYKASKDKEVVDWEAVARELGKAQPALLEALAAQHTTTRPGSRRFVAPRARGGR
jgi:putative phage-type endonuclease